MASQDVQQLKDQLQSATSQLHVLSDQLRTAEADVANGKAQLAESQRNAASQVEQLEEKLVEAVKNTEHYRKLSQLSPRTSTSAEQEILQQLQNANSSALHSSQVAHAHEREIQALQQALEATQREKEDTQRVLSKVMERHTGLLSGFVEAPGIVKSPLKNGKIKRIKETSSARRSLSPVPTTARAATRVPTPKQNLKKCADAAATAAAIKDRNHAAIKAHVSTRGSSSVRCTSTFGDEATTNRIARGAAAKTIKMAQRQEAAAEAKATRRDIEGQYLRKYSEYRELLAGKGAFSKHAAHEVQRVVQLMDELNQQAKQLLCSRTSLSPVR